MIGNLNLYSYLIYQIKKQIINKLKIFVYILSNKISDFEEWQIHNFLNINYYR